MQATLRADSALRWDFSCIVRSSASSASYLRQRYLIIDTFPNMRLHGSLRAGRRLHRLSSEGSRSTSLPFGAADRTLGVHGPIVSLLSASLLVSISMRRNIALPHYFQEILLFLHKGSRSLHKRLSSYSRHRCQSVLAFKSIYGA